MAIGISIVKSDAEHCMTKVTLTGLTVGTRYDVMRLQVRYLGDNDVGTPIYQREYPDRKGLWSSVAHRVGWQAPAATATFRDFELPLRPIRYFIVESSKVGPHEYKFRDGAYPVSRGVLDSQVVHFNRDLRPPKGEVRIRSTAELGVFTDACVVEMDGPVFAARGTEHEVMGSQYPVYVGDSRSARRGTIVFLTKNLGALNEIQRICYPYTGLIQPVVFNSGGDPTLLVDDLTALPLDVEVEQAMPPLDADMRFVHIDFVEISPTQQVLVPRSGDNDSMASEPNANFSITPSNPTRGQWITLADTSTGLGDDWDWSFDPAPVDNRVAKAYSQGSHKVRYNTPGKKKIKLRFGGSGQGYDSVTKTITVK